MNITLISLWLIFKLILTQNNTARTILHFLSRVENRHNRNDSLMFIQPRLDNETNRLYSKVFFHFFEPKNEDNFAHFRNDHFYNSLPIAGSARNNDSFYFGFHPHEINETSNNISYIHEGNLDHLSTRRRNQTDSTRNRSRTRPQTSKSISRSRLKAKLRARLKRLGPLGRHRRRHHISRSKLERIRDAKWPNRNRNRTNRRKHHHRHRPSNRTRNITPNQNQTARINNTNQTNATNYTDEDFLSYNFSNHYYINELRNANRTFHKMLMYECFMQTISEIELLELRMLVSATEENLSVFDMVPADVNMFPIKVTGGLQLMIKSYTIQRNPLDQEATEELKNGKDLTAEDSEHKQSYSDYMQAKHRSIAMIEELRKLRLMNYFPMAEDFITDRSENITYIDYSRNRPRVINQTEFFPCDQNLEFSNDREEDFIDFDINFRQIDVIPAKWVNISELAPGSSNNEQDGEQNQSPVNPQSLKKSLPVCGIPASANMTNGDLSQIFPHVDIGLYIDRMNTRIRQETEAADNRERTRNARNGNLTQNRTNNQTNNSISTRSSRNNNSQRSVNRTGNQSRSGPVIGRPSGDQNSRISRNHTFSQNSGRSPVQQAQSGPVSRSFNSSNSNITGNRSNLNNSRGNNTQQNWINNRNQRTALRNARNATNSSTNASNTSNSTNQTRPNSTFCGNFSRLTALYKDDYLNSLSRCTVEQLILRTQRLRLNQWYFYSRERQSNNPDLGLQESRFDDVDPQYVIAEMNEENGRQKDGVDRSLKFLRPIRSEPDRCPINIPGMDDPMAYPVESCSFTRRVRHNYTNCQCQTGAVNTPLFNLSDRCTCVSINDTVPANCKCKILINCRETECNCQRSSLIKYGNETFPEVQKPPAQNCPSSQKKSGGGKRRRRRRRRGGRRNRNKNRNRNNSTGNSSNNTASNNTTANYGVEVENCRFSMSNLLETSINCEAAPKSETPQNSSSSTKNQKKSTKRSKIRRKLQKKHSTQFKTGLKKVEKKSFSRKIIQNYKKSSKNKLIQNLKNNHLKQSLKNKLKMVERRLKRNKSGGNNKSGRRRRRKRRSSRPPRRPRPIVNTTNLDRPVYIPRFREFVIDAEKKHEDLASSLIYRRDNIDFQFPRYIKTFFYMDRTNYYVYSMRMFYLPFDDGELATMRESDLCSALFSLAMNVYKIHKMRLVVVTPSLEHVGRIGDGRKYVLLRDLPGLMPMTSHDYNRIYKSPGEIDYIENTEILKYVDQFAPPEVLLLTNSTEMKIGRMPKNLTARYAFNASVDIFTLGMTLIRSTRLGGFAISESDYFDDNCFTRECYNEMITDLNEDASVTFGFPLGASREIQCQRSRSGKMFKHYMLYWIATHMINFEPERRFNIFRVLRELHYLKVRDEETIFDDVDDNDWIFDRRKLPRRPGFFQWLINKVKRFARRGGFQALGKGLLKAVTGRRLVRLRDLKEALPKSPLFKLVVSDRVLQEILEEGYEKYGMKGYNDEKIPKLEKQEDLPSKENLIKFFEEGFKKDHPDYSPI